VLAVESHPGISTVTRYIAALANQLGFAARSTFFPAIPALEILSVTFQVYSERCST